MARFEIQPHWAKSFPRNPLEDWWLPRTVIDDDDETTIEELEQRVELIEAVAACMTDAVLDEVDQAVLETILVSQCSLRWAAEMTGIPKTTVARRRDGLLERLREYLETDPTVAHYLENNN